MITKYQGKENHYIERECEKGESFMIEEENVVENQLVKFHNFNLVPQFNIDVRLFKNFVTTVNKTFVGFRYFF